MYRKSHVAIFVAVLASLILAACAPAATPEAPTAAPQIIEKTVVVNQTQVVEKTVVSVITATPAPKPTTLPAGSVTINGAGATFPLPIYTEWIFAYQYVDPSVALNYQGIGSGGGKNGIIDNTLDFAGSDSVMNADNYTKGVDLQMYPAIAGAVVPIYNVTFDKYDPAKDPALPAIILDRQTLADIYQGKVTTWNADAIVKLNPALKDHLPAKPITIAYRSDASGTTEIFTNALASFSADWQTKIGAGSAIDWKKSTAKGIGGKGNAGVAGAVQNTPNSIGYVELNYAVANKIPFTQLINKAGKTVSADAKSLASAINDFAAAFDDKLNAKIVDGPGDGSWPIAGYSYLILHTKSMKDCTKAQKLLEYITWTLNDATAAKKAAELGYAVLPDAVRAKVIAKLGEVTCNNAPVLKK